MHRQMVLCCLFLPLLLLAVAASAQTYKLTDGSEHLEGCLSGLCLCPIQITSKVEGEMRLFRSGHDDFDVQDVDWRVRPDSQVLRFTGDGHYRRRGEAFSREQRMELDLSENGGESAHYDSGWLPLPQESGVIALHLPMAEIVCWGTAFGVRAVMTSTVGSESPSWSTIKSRW